MSVSIKKHFSHAPSQEQIEFKRVSNAILADMTAMHAAILGITAQLDLDATVTDTDYAANNDPAALTLVS